MPAILSGQMDLSVATESVALRATTAVATFTDSNTADRANDFRATINWGDGTTATAFDVVGSNGSFTVQGGHTYADEASAPVSVTIVRTSDNATATASGTVAVAEADHLGPQGVAIAATQGQTFSGTVATFFDSDTFNVAGDFTATIDWGDGTTSGGTVSRDFFRSSAFNIDIYSVSGTHTYATAGQDTVKVTLTDDAPGTATATANSTATVAGAPLRYIGLGDFDANTRSDVAWASNGGGHATLWIDSNGTLSQFAVPGAAMGAEWTGVGVGDFNGDGNSDLLWTNTTGQTAVWEMNGPNLIGFGIPAGQMGAEWHVAGIGDFNGDYKSDLLWGQQYRGGFGLDHERHDAGRLCHLQRRDGHRMERARHRRLQP